MKAISIVIIAGLILLYFLDTALKISLLNQEMLIHSALRFFTGFILIGIGVFYAHKIKFKTSFGLVLALVLADDIYDYFRNINSFSPEVMIHGFFFLVWGSVMGYLFMKMARKKAEKP